MLTRKKTKERRPTRESQGRNKASPPLSHIAPPRSHLSSSRHRRRLTPAASSEASTPPGAGPPSKWDPRPALAAKAGAVRASAAAGAALLASAHAAAAAAAAPLVLAFAAADAATFLIHRLGHRLTNALAVAFLPGVRAAVEGAAAAGGGGGGGGGGIGILNPWWLTNDPAIANFGTGYQWLVLLLFLAVFPLNVGVRSLATSAAAFLSAAGVGEEAGGQKAGAGPGAGGGGQKKPPPWSRAAAAALAPLVRVAPAVRAAFPRVLGVDLAVAVRAVPLQGACLALLPLPWALPRLLDLQAAGAVAALEGAPGDLALERAASLTRGHRGGLAWPYLGLLVAGRAVGGARALALAALPPRIVAGVPELALGLWLLGLAVSVWVSRVGDMLPVVARAAWAAEDAGGGGGAGV